MRGFIVYPTYRVEAGKAYVHLFGKLEDGRSFHTINYYRPYFFIKQSDKKKALEILSKLEIEDSDRKDFDENPVSKVILDIPRDVPDIRKTLEDADIPCFEADIRFAYRFLIDKELRGSLDIEGTPKDGENVDLIFEEPILKPADHKPELKVLAFDIETSMKGNELFSISISCDGFDKVFIKNDSEVKNAESVKTEKELLEKFAKTVIEQDPDIITGWNIIDFDFVFLDKKFREHKIPFKIGRTDWDAKIRVETSFMRDSRADIPGRSVLDGIQLLKMSFIKMRDYKLNTAAKQFINEEKLVSEQNKGKEIEDMFREDPERLASYNLHDSQLVLKILKKTGVIALTIERSLLTGMQLDRVMATIASFDSLYLRELSKRGYVAPSTLGRERNERIKGGFVKDSTPGLYENVIVLDFKSLYPSIIRTFNIDPLSNASSEQERDVIVAPNGAKFKNDDGILPIVIQTLWQKRDEAKKRNDEAASFAIKILMNSFFGALANPMCRFYSLDVANAITHFGQFFIKLASTKTEKMGFEVIYGDTDSIFVNTKVNTEQEASDVGIEIEDKINAFFSQKVSEEYKRKNFMELEFEKTFVKFFLPTVRHQEVGSKKRYVGIVMEDGKEKLVFVGLESVRRDWTDLAKIFQRELYMKVFHGEDISKFIVGYVERLRAGDFDNMLVYRKALTKSLSEYTKTTPPHVKAARQLENLNSNIIEYLMTVSGPEALEIKKSSIDYEHYIQKQLKPIANSVLLFLNMNFDDVVDKHKQTSLSDY